MTLYDEITSLSTVQFIQFMWEMEEALKEMNAEIQAAAGGNHRLKNIKLLGNVFSKKEKN